MQRCFMIFQTILNKVRMRQHGLTYYAEHNTHKAITEAFLSNIAA